MKPQDNRPLTLEISPVVVTPFLVLCFLMCAGVIEMKHFCTFTSLLMILAIPTSTITYHDDEKAEETE
jgi:hypothetical protein